ncbi:DUF4190 domain-containing protein [Streptomyces sp. NK08204]|uniref:DUF4190 domain-containing protein n=1 Tax=Streptomyces sp. NK08204 TaxID=2873260 RepID=UPI0021F226DE|nr:DUF4190 domain-containing protein [Streptomyces sp. NK08204]
MSDEVPQPIPTEQGPGDRPTVPRVSLGKPGPAPSGAPGAGSIHDQQTLTSLPAASVAGAAGPAPADAVRPAWAPPAGAPAHPFPPFGPAPAHPYGPPASAPAASATPYASPMAPGAQPQNAAVPAPPLAPGGPGQVPYGGYPGGPAPHGYAYPGQVPQPQHGAGGIPSYPAANGYGWPGFQPVPHNGMGTASLVLGISAAVFFCLWPLALVAGIVAVVLGALARGKAARGEATNPGVALAGIICGAAGIVLVLGLVAFYIAYHT